MFVHCEGPSLSAMCVMAKMSTEEDGMRQLIGALIYFIVAS